MKTLSRFLGLFSLILLLFSLALSACQGSSGGDDASSSPPDDDSSAADDSAPDDTAADDSAGDDTDLDDDADDSSPDDTTDDDTMADDTSDDTSADDTGDDDTYPQLEMPPDDGRLYAASAHVVITPNAINHPGPIYLGGTSRNRVATGVHDDLLASALILATHDDMFVIVSMDLMGFTRFRTKQIQDELAKYGLDGNKVFISSTHDHEGPDCVGLWGPDTFTSGASPTYARFLVQTVTDLVVNLWAELVPVTMRAAAVDVNEPASNIPSLVNDYRDPFVTTGRVSTARFDDDGSQTVATLINWNTHAESTICSTEITADFPHYLRQRVEDLSGGNAVYVAGSVGGLATPLGVLVPGRDEDGNPILDGDGNPVLFSDCTWDHSRSLGFIVADYTLNALASAETVTNPTLAVTSEQLLLPFTNPEFWLALWLGVIDYDESTLVTGDPNFCGPVGCADERIGYVRAGPLAIVTSPGETFTETLIGRGESTIDYGPPWGPTTYPAMTGYETYLPAGTVPLHIGLCNDEIGYMVPITDFHPINHPQYYCESDDISFRTEQVYRLAVIDLLTR